jgi:hypothetical protein
MKNNSIIYSVLDSYERTVNTNLSLLKSNEFNIKNEIENLKKSISRKETLLESNLKTQEEIKIKQSVVYSIRQEFIKADSNTSDYFIDKTIRSPFFSLSSEPIKPLSSDFLTNILSKQPNACDNNHLWPQDIGDPSPCWNDSLAKIIQKLDK